MKKRIRSPAWQAVTLVIINGIFFGFTDPLKVSPHMLIIAVVLIAVSLYWGLSQATQVLHRSVGLPHAKKPVIGLTLLLAGLLAMQSISQLSVRDIAITLPLAVLAYFYAAYNRPQLAIVKQE